MQEQVFRRGLSPEARKYAVKELARRAGVSHDIFHSWEVEVRSDCTVLTIVPDGSKTIAFPHAPDDVLSDIATGRFPIAEAGWPEQPRDALLKQNLVLPFLKPNGDAALPLFVRREGGSFTCTKDVLLCLLLTLGRYEELLPGTRDEHGRFPTSSSIAAQHGFLERPIVDEYGLAFEQILSAALPGWHSQRSCMRLKLTHDVDGVGVPCRLRTSIGHTVRRKDPLASVRDLISAFTVVEPAELALVRALAQNSKTRGLHSAFFWKGSPPGPMDSGYDPFHPKVQRVITYLKDEGFEVGVHPGYDTFGSRSALREEVQRLREALGVQEVGGRQHYLRWSPQTWHDWESCGLVYDSSVGFADCFGFRAGTAIPFRPWSFSENRELKLLEVPLILMDRAAAQPMAPPWGERLDRIRDCIHLIALVGGVFTVLWHNAVLMEPEYDGWYEAVLNLLPSCESLGFPDSQQIY